MASTPAPFSARARTAGEILVHGPQVMAGYWQRPDETAKVIGKDGFLRLHDAFATGPDDALWLDPAERVRIW